MQSNAISRTSRTWRVKTVKKGMDICNGADMVEYARSAASAAMDAQLLAELKQGALLEKHRALPA